MEEENRFRSWACSWGVKDIIKEQAFITHTHTKSKCWEDKLHWFIHFSPYRVKGGAKFKKWYNAASIHLFTPLSKIHFFHYIHLSVKPLCTCHVKYQYIHSCLLMQIFYSSPYPSIHLHTQQFFVSEVNITISLSLQHMCAYTHTIHMCSQIITLN